jgi:tetratricopeptide (TPR) repeat protein
MAYENMARLAAARGNVAEKDKYFAMLKEIIKDVPLSFQAGLFFLGMGVSERAAGNYETARQLIEDGLKVFERLQSRNFQNIMLSELGHIARQMGDLQRARDIYVQTLATWQDFGNRAAISHQLECFGFLAIADEEPHKATRLIGAADALREKTGNQMTDYERLEYDRALLQLQSMIPPEEFRSLWTEGRAMDMEAAIQLALSREGHIDENHS